MQIKNKHSIIIILTLLLFLAVEALYIFILPDVINIESKVRQIEKTFNEKTDANLELENIKLKTHADFSFTLMTDKINIYSKNNENMIKGNNTAVRIYLLPFIINRLEIKNIRADYLNLNAVRYKNGKYNFEKLLFKSDKKKLKVVFKNARFDIAKYDFSFVDELLNKNIRIQGQYFKINNLTLKKHIDIDTQGTLITPFKTTPFQIRFYTKLPVVDNIDSHKFTIEGFIRDFDCSYFFPYFKSHIKSGTKNISGNLNLSFHTKKLSKFDKDLYIEGVISNLLIQKINPYNNIRANGKNIINAKFNFDSNSVKIINLNLKGDGYNLDTSGKIEDYKKDKPYLNFDTSLKNSKAETISAILPSNLIKDREEIAKVKKYGIKGDINVKMKFKGRVPAPDIFGTIDINNIHILKGLDDKHIGVVKLIFDKRTLYTNVKVSTSDNQYVLVKGTTYLNRDRKNHFEISSTEKLNIPLVQILLLPIRDVFEFQLGPVPDMKIKAGTGSTKLNIVGTRESARVKGYVKFKDATASYNGINADFYGVDGSVNFYGPTLSYKTTKAFTGKYPVSLDGNAILNQDVSFNIQSKFIDSKILLDIVRTSSLLEELDKNLEVINKISGLTEFKLNVKAKIENLNKAKLTQSLDDMEVKGSLRPYNATCYLQGFKIPFKNIKGLIEFGTNNTKLTSLDAVIGTSNIKAFGTISKNTVTNLPSVNISVTGDKVKLTDSLRFVDESDASKEFKFKLSHLTNTNAIHSLKFNYNASSKDVDMSAISFVAKFIPQKASEKNIVVNSGIVSLSRGILKFQNLNGKIYNTLTKISGEIKHIYDKNPYYDLNIDVRNLDVSALNDSNKTKDLPHNFRAFLANYTDYSGLMSANIKITGNEAKGNIHLNNIKLIHKQTSLPLNIDSASVNLDGNKMSVKTADAKFAEVPIYTEFEVFNTDKTPTINGYLSTKLTEKLMDNFVNDKISYPIKIKGDISMVMEFSGTLDHFRISPVLKLEEGSDLSYLSSNIGDDSILRELNSNLIILPNRINIQKLEYIKYIESQNGKETPVSQMLIKGSLKKTASKYLPDTFLVKTNANMPARLLNFAFKKSILKQGTFNCSIFYKNNPETNVSKIFGNIDFKNVDIPLYDTLIRDISLKTTRDSINVDLKGKIFESDLSISSVLENKLSLPVKVKELNIMSQKLNFDTLFNTFNKISLESYQNKIPKNKPEFDVSRIIIHKGHILAEDVQYKSLSASKFNADFGLDKNSILKINNIDSNIADGTLKGDGEYNFKTTELEVDLIAKNVDSAVGADAFFDMKNQIYGNMNSQLYMKTKGSNKDDRLKNLSGLVYFNITDGKMPKLGSLEYLLRASNLVKSGITGLTINSIIDIVNPVRTGHFSTINGNFALDNGIAKNVEIFSKGENLSIYIKGSYDLVNVKADMRILGKLSKKIPTILGPLGDTSLNTFLNAIPRVIMTEADKVKYLKDVLKIPGLDFNNDDYRIFQAEIDGNINGTNYVKTFKWVE